MHTAQLNEIMCAAVMVITMSRTALDPKYFTEFCSKKTHYILGAYKLIINSILFKCLLVYENRPTKFEHEIFWCQGFFL